MRTIYNKINSSSLLLLTVLFYLSCTPNPTATIIINDASKPIEEEVLVEVKEGQFVDKLYIHITGYINDTAKVEPYYFIPPGKVDTTIRTGDWYSTNYRLQYDPMNVTEGSLHVVIEFIAF